MECRKEDMSQIDTCAMHAVSRVNSKSNIDIPLMLILMHAEISIKDSLKLSQEVSVAFFNNFPKSFL